MIRHKLLLGSICCSVLLCLTLVNVVDRWTPASAPRAWPVPAQDSHQVSEKDLEELWEQKYERRVQRVRDACEADEVAAMRRVWRVAANRRFGKDVPCSPGSCPIIVDENRVLFFCFVPGVASALVKRFFLNVSGVALNESVSGNDTLLHKVADERLARVSPMYYPSSTVNRFFKILFVRHPFERLVSVYRDMERRPPDQVQLLYDRYWNSFNKKLGKTRSPSEGIPPFSEFVRYLVRTPLREYDRQFVPYWSRCDPCLVDYDFVGKLETAQHDFSYAFRKVGIDTDEAWWRGTPDTTRTLALHYFLTVPKDSIKRLHDIYRLDFELFGYSTEGFLPSNQSSGAA